MAEDKQDRKTKKWSIEDTDVMVKMLSDGSTHEEVGIRLGRSTLAVKGKAVRVMESMTEGRHVDVPSMKEIMKNLRLTQGDVESYEAYRKQKDKGSGPQARRTHKNRTGTRGEVSIAYFHRVNEPKSPDVYVKFHEQAVVVSNNMDWDRLATTLGVGGNEAYWGLSDDPVKRVLDRRERITVYTERLFEPKR